MSLWNIVVPGLAADIAEHLTDDGVVCCVNAALSHVPRCDYWVCYDAPNDLHIGSFDACRRHRPIVVTEKNRHKPWREMTRDWDLLDQPSVVVCDWKPLWFAVAIKIGPRYSTFMAMLFALQGGATEIRVHGSTMLGVGYCNDKANEQMRVRQRPPRYWSSRWEKERAMMNAAERACKERGVGFRLMEVSKVKPRAIKNQRAK